MNSRQFLNPSVLTLGIAVVAIGGIVACQSSLSVDASSNTWGFVNIDATVPAAGDTQVAPKAQFFQANISAVPNAQIVLDSCNDVAYSPPIDVTGVTFMDAGDAVTAVLGGQTTVTLPRTATSSGSVYELAGGSSVPYHPGDSVVVTVPGAVGGFPGSSVRAKTSESFTFDPIVLPIGTNPIQLRWSRADDFNSAMVVELRYAPQSSGGSITREVLCSYTDDGVDSIPFSQYQTWSNQSNTATEVVMTRLRTSFQTVTNGILEVISTYQVPTPQTP